MAGCPELSPERLQGMSDADILAAMDACCTKATAQQLQLLARSGMPAGSAAAGLVASAIADVGPSECTKSIVGGAFALRREVLVRGCTQCMQLMAAGIKG